MAKRLPQTKEIDLHGIRHKQALALVRTTLMYYQEENCSFSLNIITGNSTTLQELIYEEILEHSTFNYFIPSWNLGQIIVEQTVL